MADTCKDVRNILGRDVDILKVYIGGEDIASCERFAVESWASKKTGNYGGGMTATDEDKGKPIRAGKYGEVAFAEVYGGAVDWAYKHGGDEYDFLVGDATDRVRLDVKTKLYWCCPDRFTIRKVDDEGRECPLVSDVYVFACLDEERRSSVAVSLVGWLTRREVERCSTAGVRHAKGGRHVNWEVYYDDLRPLRSLREVLDGTVPRSWLTEGLL